MEFPTKIDKYLGECWEKLNEYVAQECRKPISRGVYLYRVSCQLLIAIGSTALFCYFFTDYPILSLTVSVPTAATWAMAIGGMLYRPRTFLWTLYGVGAILLSLSIFNLYMFASPQV